jgi:hypothetical protein
MIKDDKMSLDLLDKFANENELLCSKYLTINQNVKDESTYTNNYSIFDLEKIKVNLEYGKRRKNISRYKILKVHQYN